MPTSPLTLSALNNIVYRGNADFNGNDILTVTTSDLGNTGSGGTQTDVDTVAFTVNPVSDAPAGTDNTLTINEDLAHTFTAADFGFTDPSDTPADAFTNLRITDAAGQRCADTERCGGDRRSGDRRCGHYGQPAGVHPPALTTTARATPNFTFQVQDNGANPGETEDQSPNTITFDVTAVSDAPAGTDNALTINEDTAHTFTAADFGFTDPSDTPPDNFTGVRITSGLGAGAITLNGTAVTAGQIITIADINAGLLVFTPDANEHGTSYASYTFQVQDDGANPGETEDQSPNTITFNVDSVSDAPSGQSAPLSTNENTDHVFTTANFGFSDPNDTPPDTFTGVKITTARDRWPASAGRFTCYCRYCCDCGPDRRRRLCLPARRRRDGNRLCDVHFPGPGQWRQSGRDGGSEPERPLPSM